MMNRAHIEPSGAPARALVVAAEPAGAEPLAQELVRRGAFVSTVTDIAQAAAAVRRDRYDVILVATRADPNATALLLRLLRAEAAGAPQILLLVDLAVASRYGLALPLADETLAASLPPQRIVDATGIGLTA